MLFFEKLPCTRFLGATGVIFCLAEKVFSHFFALIMIFRAAVCPTDSYLSIQTVLIISYNTNFVVIQKIFTITLFHSLCSLFNKVLTMHFSYQQNNITINEIKILQIGYLFSFSCQYPNYAECDNVLKNLGKQIHWENLKVIQEPKNLEGKARYIVVFLRV